MSASVLLESHGHGAPLHASRLQQAQTDGLCRAAPERPQNEWQRCDDATLLSLATPHIDARCRDVRTGWSISVSDKPVSVALWQLVCLCPVVVVVVLSALGLALFRACLLVADISILCNTYSAPPKRADTKKSHPRVI